MERIYGISGLSFEYDGRRRGAFTKIRDLQPGDEVEVFFQGGGTTRRIRTSIVDIRPTSQDNNPRVLLGASGRIVNVGGGTIARKFLSPQP